MVQTPDKVLTLAEFLELPETKPGSEYMEGKIIPKPMPNGKQSTLQTELSMLINLTLKPQKIARAFLELRCTFGSRSIIPDISVFCERRIPRDQKGEIADDFFLAPDWIIEILSPEQSQTKVVKNILYCLNAETEMGWLIDPKEQTVFVYQLEQIKMFDQWEQSIPVPSFAQSLTLTLGDILGLLI